MWLLHATTGELSWHTQRPLSGYFILSHVWTAEEQTYQDIKVLQHAGGLASASAKIRDCCAFARRRGYEWVWIDTCCIDKTSSAELSEAINSMFVYYRDSDECVAFLQDVHEEDDPHHPKSQFRSSRWFTRGWTLQELIAPRRLVFVSKNWQVIGTKATLADVVAEVTGIDREILTFRKSHSRVSVARRMSWAANRQTTREEDRAYSLLGIFDVNISTVYGEGDHAFIRLQEEILKHIPDQSIFAWGPPMLRDSGALKRSVNSAGKLRLRALLAVTPDMFQHSAEVKPIAPEMLERRLGTRVPPAHFTLTSYGMHSRLPLLKAPGFSYAERRPVWLAVLACVDGAGHLVALILQPQSQETRDRFFVGASVYIAQQLSTGSLYCDDYRLAALDTPRRVLSWGFAAKLREIYIPHRLDTSNFQFPDPLDDRPMILEQPKRRRRDIIAAPCEVAIPAWVIRNLEREHWVKVTMPEPQTTSLRFETGDHRPKEIRLISESSETIVIKVWTCPNDAFQYIHTVAYLEDEALHARDAASSEGACLSEHVSEWDDHWTEFKLSAWTMRLVFETLNLQFRGMFSDEHNGVALYSLTIHLSSKQGYLDKDQSTTSIEPAPYTPIHASSYGHGGITPSSEWKYWDGHMGQRPLAYIDAASTGGNPTSPWARFGLLSQRIHQPIFIKDISY